MDNRRDSIKEGKAIFARQFQDRFGERWCGEGACCDNAIAPRLWRQITNFAIFNRNQRMLGEYHCHRVREVVTVHRQRAARRELMQLAHAHDEAIAAPHFLV